MNDWKPVAFRLWQEGLSWTDIVTETSNECGTELTKDKIRTYIRATEEYKKAHESEMPRLHPLRPSKTEIFKDGSRRLERIIEATEEDLKSPEDIMRLCGLNPKNWVIEHFTYKPYNVYSKVDGIQDCLSTTLKVKPSTVISLEELMQEFVKRAEKYSPVQPREIKQSTKNLKLFNLTDVHEGQLSWGKESGENYDYKIVEKKFKTIVNDSISKSPYKSYERIDMIFGNDYFNSDNLQGTTSKGTQQTNDIRPQKMFMEGIFLYIWGIDAHRTAYPNSPINIWLVPGNHDTLTSFYAIFCIYCWFRNDPSVTVDISPKQHKGFAYGNTALLFTHGQRELTHLEWVYNEFRELIGTTKSTEIHSGHLHRIKVEEKNGVLIRTNPSIAALSGWSYGEGYGSIAQAITRVYSKEGLDYEIYSRA